MISLFQLVSVLGALKILHTCLFDLGFSLAELVASLPHGIAQGVALVLDCGWIKGLGRLFLQLLPLVLPIKHLISLTANTGVVHMRPGRQPALDSEPSPQPRPRARESLPRQTNVVSNNSCPSRGTARMIMSVIAQGAPSYPFVVKRSGVYW